MSDRSVFLYIDPKGGADSQCGTCYLWIRGDHCLIHGSRRITAKMACCYYLHGTPRPAGTPPQAIVTPDESGLVERQVRCENCRHFSDRHCELFARLNSRLPAVFDLDTAVEARGCCTAQEPRDAKKKREERLKDAEV